MGSELRNDLVLLGLQRQTKRLGDLEDYLAGGYRDHEKEPER